MGRAYCYEHGFCMKHMHTTGRRGDQERTRQSKRLREHTCLAAKQTRPEEAAKAIPCVPCVLLVLYVHGIRSIYSIHVTLLTEGYLGT